MRNVGRPKPGDVIARRPRPAETRPTIINIPLPRAHDRGLASPLSVVFSLLGLLALGTALLLLPFSNTQGSLTPFMTALFTAASAVTVTGLVVADTAVYWSPLGQAIIWVLILAGGMGWMTVAGFTLIILGQRITLPQRLALREPLGTTQIGGVLRTVRNMMITFLLLQAAGGVILTLRFQSAFHWEWPKALWQGFFHAVAGFTNAGFTIMPGSASLSRFSDDTLVLGVMGLLIMLGGLSYPVMADLMKTRRFGRYSLDTKIVLTGSVALWLLGALVIFAFEYAKSETLGPMGAGDKLLNAAFHSISARSGGFSTVPIGALTSATAFFIMGLMFIGSASASVGGGIRLNTLGVLVATVAASLVGRSQVNAFGRELAQNQVQRAIAVTTLAGLAVFVGAFILTLTDPGLKFIDLIFEVVSAVGTVGLSRGITPELSVIGKLLIIGAMALGRMGPLVLALSLIHREQRPPLYRNARERVKIG